MVPKVSILDFAGAKDDGGGGDNWSYKTGSSNQIVTTNIPTPNSFTDQMPFLSPQSTEGRYKPICTNL